MDAPLTCKEVVELISDYIEGTLPEDTRRRLEEHLAGCDGCTHYLEQMRETIRVTGKVEEQAMTAEERSELITLFREWKEP
jgi:anti-sigma factor RsiW